VALNSTNVKVVVRGVGILTNHTGELVLSDLVFEDGVNCTARGLSISGSLAMYADSVLQAEPGGTIAFSGAPEISFWPEAVVGSPPRYAVPFLDLGDVGTDFHLRPRMFSVNVSAEVIEEFPELDQWAQPVVTARTLNCEEWVEVADVASPEVFGVMCSPQPVRRLNDANTAPVSTLFVRRKPPKPEYVHGTESTVAIIIMFIVAVLVVVGTVAVFVIICKGPPPPDKSEGEIPADDGPEMEPVNVPADVL
jgi:hypothetical protein